MDTLYAVQQRNSFSVFPLTCYSTQCSVFWSLFAGSTSSFSSEMKRSGCENMVCWTLLITFTPNVKHKCEPKNASFSLSGLKLCSFTKMQFRQVLISIDSLNQISNQKQDVLTYYVYYVSLIAARLGHIYFIYKTLSTS